MEIKNKRAALLAASRVLTAVIDRQAPDEADAAKLREQALLLDVPIDRPVDEVACEVIRRISCSADWERPCIGG